MNGTFTWDMPAGWLPVAKARKQAVDQLIGRITPVVEQAWKDEIPQKARGQIARQVSRGVRQAVEALTLSPTSKDAEALWGNSIFLNFVCKYWEPPVASKPVSAPEEHLRAYRWAAGYVAMFVRNSLEDLHAKYTSDDNMPALNKGVRNAAFDVLLGDEWMAYYLGLWPALLLQTPGLEKVITLPALVG